MTPSLAFGPEAILDGDKIQLHQGLDAPPGEENRREETTTEMMGAVGRFLR